MAVRFDDKLNNEIERTFKNYNAKVRYNKNKTKGKGMLPRVQSAAKFRDKYSDKSRNEIKKQLKLYQDFGKRKSLDLSGENRLSVWEKNYFEKNLEKTQRFYDEEIADLEHIIGDKPEYHMRLHNRLQTLIKQREALNKDLNNLTETQIKGFRAYFNYAERSEIIKRQGFRLYLAQLDRTMDALGYSVEDRNQLLDKFNVLSENEFTEMVRNEDMIDGIYDLVDSPKGRGKFELIGDQKTAEEAVTNILSHADELVAKYKTSK